MAIPQKASVRRRRVLLVATLIIPLALIVVRSALNASNQNMEVKRSCACLLNCMDGRVQIIGQYAAKKLCGADIVDAPNQAGVVKELADNKNKALIDNLREEVELSVKNHNARSVVIGAHYDCAKNRVPKEQQLKDLRAAKKVVQSWNLGVEVKTVWFEPSPGSDKHAPFDKWVEVE